jgi:hypothetical protein
MPLHLPEQSSDLGPLVGWESSQCPPGRTLGSGEGSQQLQESLEVADAGLVLVVLGGQSRLDLVDWFGHGWCRFAQRQPAWW